jgi:hypothetical protein
MNLAEISFPVFKLKTTRPLTEQGLVFYRNETLDLDTAESATRIRVVDDQSLSGTSLGRRRLQLKQAKVPLYPIKVTIYFLGDLVKLTSRPCWFIDNTGKLFQYKKSTRAKLHCKKISKVFPLKGLGSVIEVEGMTTRFKTIFKPQDSENYAGIVEYSGGAFLYGLYEEPFNTTWRKI